MKGFDSMVVDKIRRRVGMTIARKIIAFSDKIKYIGELLLILGWSHGSTRISQYKNGERIFLLGNGPSLKNVLSNCMDELRREKTFCVNNMSSCPEYSVIKPRYYVMVDPVYTGLIKRENLSDKEKKERDLVLDGIVKKTNWEMILFLPYSSQNQEWLISKLSTNKCVHPYFIRSVPFERRITGIGIWLMKKGYVAPRFQNVMIAAVYLSLMMGYKKVYLLGVDHNWMKNVNVNDNNELMLEYEHFYQEKIYQGNLVLDGEHAGWHYHDWLNAMQWMFVGYHQLAALAKNMETEIYNCTPGSFIDAFKRKSIQEVW